MRIVVTGASGFVGQQVCPFLKSDGMDLVYVGRDIDALKSIFGADAEVASYSDLDGALAGADALLHLAVMNNSQKGTYDEFKAVNVGLLQQVLQAAGKNGIATFIYTATTHVDAKSETPYAMTKREAEAVLSEAPRNVDVSILRLPAVYGDDAYSGKLAVLKRVPSVLRGTAFNFLAALRPTVHAELVAQAAIFCTRGPNEPETLVSDRQMKNGVYAFGIRTIDVVFAVAVIAIFWWLLLVVWMLVKFTSPGPGLFAQKRIGRHGKIFTCYKFRTMRDGTKVAGTHEVSASNVTGVGKIIRKLKIDELPQVWNVLRNQMSLVGPRPCLPVQQELIDERTQRGVLDAKCGLTGLAQIMNIDMSEPKRLAKVDAQYLALRTLPLDLKIILKTFIGAGRADRVNPDAD